MYVQEKFAARELIIAYRNNRRYRNNDQMEIGGQISEEPSGGRSTIT